MRAALKTRESQVARLERQFLDAAADDDPEAAMYQIEYNAAREGLVAAKKKLKDKEAALGVSQNQDLKRLAGSEYMRLRMNARALLRRLRDRLRSRKFELDKVERSYRRLVNGERARFIFSGCHGLKGHRSEVVFAYRVRGETSRAHYQQSQ
jgi:hypothetical protein